MVVASCGPRAASAPRRDTAMYDEAADFAAHRAEMATMDAALAECRAVVDWPNAVVCDVGGGGGLRAGLLAARARRVHCADVIDQHARYGGEFLKLQAEKFARHGEPLPLERYAFDVTDATRLLYRDGAFDFVCSVNALEHIPDPVQAMAEMARVLRPGGIAYVTFDPIWTADTGSHFERRVPEPWAHLVLDDDEFVRRMRAAGAEDWELQDFRCGMNRVRLSVYEHLFRAGCAEMGLEILLHRTWRGVTDDRHLQHPNWTSALRTYSRDELLTRGMLVVARKRR
jgi:SAM-dependent methyltransferase